MSASLEWKADTSGIDDLLAKHPQNKGRFMDAMAEQSITLMRLKMDTSPPGETYERGDRVHVASVKGYPPNIDYGDLYNSLRWERRGTDEREIHGAEHGLHLEDSSELDRPFISPAFRDLQDDVVGLGQQWLLPG